MKTAALSLVLCCCATVRPAIPSSLPFITVDPALSGAVASEAAAKVFLKRQERERAASAKVEADLTGKINVLTQRLAADDAIVARNAWWGVYGLPVAAGSGIAGAVITAAVFLVVIFRGGK